MASDAPRTCPCVQCESPTAPCTLETCFHFNPKAKSCANCNVGVGPNEMTELDRLRADNKNLREMCRWVLPKLRRILQEDDDAK